MGYDIHLTDSYCDLFKRVAAVGMQDFSRLVHLCHFALQVHPLDGALVEFGCFNGDTMKLLAAITGKETHLYDSFQGLPDIGEVWAVDGQTGAISSGAMATLPDTVMGNFCGEPLVHCAPIVHAGWFSDLSPADLPAKIALAHIDGDLYASTLQALRLVYDRVVPGGVILVDDYEEPYFAGPKKAVDEFLADKPEKAVALQGTNGAKAYKAVITILPRCRA